MKKVRVISNSPACRHYLDEGWVILHHEGRWSVLCLPVLA